MRERLAPSTVPGRLAVRMGALLWLAPLTLPLLSFFRSSASAPAELLVAATATLTAIVPAAGIALAAACVPMGLTVAAGLNVHFPLTEPLALAVAAGGTARYLIAPRPIPAGAGPIVAWTALLALLTAASAIVACATQLAFYPSGAALLSEIWRALAVSYFGGPEPFDTLHAAMVAVEGLALLTLAVVALDSTRTRVIVARLLLAGGAAVATQNIVRLCQVALRADTDFLDAIARDLVAARVSAAFADVNSAGSYLVMIFVTACVWWWHRRTVWLAVSIPPLALALWISGSRSALAAGALALAIVSTPRRGRRWTAAILVLVAVGALFAAQRLRTVGDPSSAVLIRVELLKTGARMLAMAPVFGIGIGRFYETSEQFVSPALARFYVRENAHNQYMQVAAELGLTGLAAFLAILALVFRRALRDRPRPDAVRDAIVAGLLAFVSSAVGGHPLLVPEVALAFWIVVGLAWASSPAPPEHTRDASATREAAAPGGVPAAGRWAFGAAVVLLAVSIPWRVGRATTHLQLEHVGVGLSQWERDEEGRRYRIMHGRAAIYVPAQGEPARFLARVGVGGPPELRLSLWLDRRLVNEVTLSREWREVVLIVPRSGDAAYRRLELHATLPAGTPTDAAAEIGIVRGGG
jgi:O-antigen ligase